MSMKNNIFFREMTRIYSKKKMKIKEKTIIFKCILTLIFFKFFHKKKKEEKSKVKKMKKNHLLYIKHKNIETYKQAFLFQSFYK